MVSRCLVSKSAFTPAPVVIKYGGNAMTDPALRAAMAAEIARVPGVVVVHGGGPFIGAALAEAGLSSRFVRGLRVTDAASLPVIETTLTMLGKELAQALGRGVGLTGRDAGLLVAETFDAALGRVGRVTAVNRPTAHRTFRAWASPRFLRVWRWTFTATRSTSTRTTLRVPSPGRWVRRLSF